MSAAALTTPALDLKPELSRLLAAGLSVVPASKSQKRPVGSWAKYQDARPKSVDELASALASPLADGLALICGEVSGGVEVLDFDDTVAEAKFVAAVRATRPELYARLPRSRTQSGGMHVLFRCPGHIEGSQVLAAGWAKVSGPGEHPAGSRKKPHKARQVEGGWVCSPVAIETRGQGGLIIACPTSGYTLESGDLAAIPVIAAEDRAYLFSLARSFDERPDRGGAGTAAPVGRQPHEGPVVWTGYMPGDTFNQRVDLDELTDLLTGEGWKLIGQDRERLHFCRPGKSEGVSATLSKAGKVFWVFSTSTDLPAEKGMSPFDLFTHLKHRREDGGVDYAAAHEDLRGQGYWADPAEDFSPILPGDLAELPPAPGNLYIAPPVSGNDLGRTPPPPRKWVFSGDGGLPRGVVGIVAGQGGCAKSTWTLQLAASIASETDCLDGAFAIEAKGPVLLVNAEDDQEELGRRLYAIREAVGEDIDLSRLHVVPRRAGDPRLIERDTGRNLRVTQGFRDLKKRIQDLQPVLIIVDSLSVTAGEAETSNPDGAFTMSRLAELADAGDRASLLVVTHVSKGSLAAKNGARKPRKDAPTAKLSGGSLQEALDPLGVRGSSSLVNNSRWCMTATLVPARDREDLGTTAMVTAYAVRKTNYSRPLDCGYLVHKDHQASGTMILGRYDGPRVREEQRESHKQALLDLIPKYEPASRNDWKKDASARQALVLNRDDICAFLDELVDEGRVVEVKVGKKLYLEVAKSDPKR